MLVETELGVPITYLGVLLMYFMPWYLFKLAGFARQGLGSGGTTGLASVEPAGSFPCCLINLTPPVSKKRTHS